MTIETQKVSRNLEFLQVVRGVAATLVLLFHMTLTLDSAANVSFLGGFFRFGNSGVEIFFVLSGFIISYTSNKLLGSGRIGEYLFKRTVRVYPIYWIVISVFLIPILALGLNSAYSPNAANLISTYLLLPSHPMVNGVSWSLSFELYFYALFSLLTLSRKFIIAFGAIFLLTLIQIAAPVFSPNTLATDFFFSPFVLLFLMGMLVFHLFHKKLLVPSTAVCLAGIIVCIITFVTYAQFFHGQVYSSIVYGLISAALIHFLVNYEIAKRPNVPKALVLLGDASYVLYLIHLPILNFCIKAFVKYISDPALLITAIAIVALTVVGASVVVHLKIERPLVRILRRLQRPQPA